MRKNRVRNEDYIDIKVYSFYAIKRDCFENTTKTLYTNDIVQVEDIWEEARTGEKYVYVYHMKNGFRVPVLADDLTKLPSVSVKLTATINCPVCGLEYADYDDLDETATCKYCDIVYNVDYIERE